jgi:hypothetical protein
VAAAVAVGTAVASLTLFGVQALMAGLPASSAPVTSGPAPLLLLIGTMTALLASGALAWHLLAPVDSWYRRGGLAIVSAFGTFVMAVLATPLHHFLGPLALLALAAVAAGAGLLLARERAAPEHG